MMFEFSRIPLPSSRPNQNRPNGVAGLRRNGERLLRGFHRNAYMKVKWHSVRLYECKPLSACQMVARSESFLDRS
ncbi:hypothetical protein NL676_033737 [Syzygium grande]|nr:hypothetical protein NL676_033737 [Syzygium grande]